MEPKGQPNEQMEEVVLQPTQPKLVSFSFVHQKLLFFEQTRFSNTTQIGLPNQNPQFYF